MTEPAMSADAMLVHAGGRREPGEPAVLATIVAWIRHDGRVTIYTGFASFYDRIMGDRSEEVDRIRSYVSRHLPDARALLELGCGTGALLAGLAARRDIRGS